MHAMDLQDVLDPSQRASTPLVTGNECFVHKQFLYATSYTVLAKILTTSCDFFTVCYTNAFPIAPHLTLCPLALPQFGN